MKTRFKVLISIGVIIAAIGGFCGGVILNGTYFPNANKVYTHEESSSWMSYINDTVRVEDVVIPGAHDAGTNEINWLGKTQGYCIKDQLTMGTRYFDIRVNKTEDGYKIYHAFFDGCDFVTVLNDIHDWLVDHPSETLLLDFQHFKGDAKDDVFTMVQNTLEKNHLTVENTTDMSDLEYISSLTLGEARGKCIVFFGEGSAYTENDFIFERNGDSSDSTGMSLNSTYIDTYHKMSSKKFIQEGLPYYYQQIYEKIETEGHKGIFVLQGQLTDGKYIFGPYAREKTHDKKMSSYIKKLATSENLKVTNVIMRDFIVGRKCDEIIALNSSKGNVKASEKSAFDAIYASSLR